MLAPQEVSRTEQLDALDPTAEAAGGKTQSPPATPEEEAAAVVRIQSRVRGQQTRRQLGSPSGREPATSRPEAERRLCDDRTMEL